MKTRIRSQLEKTSGFRRGQVEGILIEMVENIFDMLALGQSVTVGGLGAFQTALTSEGFESPEQVTPGKVSVSRVYFTVGPEFSRRVKKIKCVRIPFKYYIPESMLTKGMKKMDREQEEIEYGIRPAETEEVAQE